MAWFLFIDESGHDAKEAPCAVLAGIAVRDRDVWSLICEIHELERTCFGRRYRSADREIKAKKILKRKVFRHAGQELQLDESEIVDLACSALENGAHAGAREVTALARAKLNYVKRVLETCKKHDCRIFASIVARNAPPTRTDGLRKDYSYLLERFYYFLEKKRHQHGIVIFDELEKSRCHLLIDQVYRYYRDTATGRARASLIVPEPFFVHSDLTTGIQIADLVAYIISWGYRFSQMSEPVREELSPFVDLLVQLRWKTRRNVAGDGERPIWSVCYIDDLRTRSEKTLPRK